MEGEDASPFAERSTAPGEGLMAVTEETVDQ
jgi:hypothetical protein